MSLHQYISVNTHYTRSVNLERDSSSIDVINAYIPTSRALRTFDRISQVFNTEIMPRAWSLIGPYGSGKSSFSVFLSQLLSSSDDESTKAAQKVLKRADSALCSKYTREIEDTEGYLKVLITGSPEAMTKRILFVGAASGFGKGTAIELARRGHSVIARVQIAPQKTELIAVAEEAVLSCR